MVVVYENFKRVITELGEDHAHVKRQGGVYGPVDRVCRILWPLRFAVRVDTCDPASVLSLNEHLELMGAAAFGSREQQPNNDSEVLALWHFVQAYRVNTRGDDVNDVTFRFTSCEVAQDDVVKFRHKPAILGRYVPAGSGFANLGDLPVPCHPAAPDVLCFCSHPARVNGADVRNLLYTLARLLGDVGAVRKGKVGRRVGRRVAVRATGEGLGRLFK